MRRARLVVAFAVPGAVFAAEAPDALQLELAPITVTGSRVETQSFEQPYSLDVVGARRIGEGQPRVNASEALSGVPGLVVANRHNYAQDLQVSARGFGARAAFGVRGVKLIADGIPASNPDGQGQLATFNLDTAERIEVLRGPFSAVYGNHAGGVVQLFSRDGAGEPQILGNALAGSWGTHKTGLGFEGARSGADHTLAYLVDASRFSTDGYREHSAATRDQAFAKLTLTGERGGRLRLVASGLRQDDTQDPLGLSWASYARNSRAVDPVARLFDTRKSIDHVQGGLTWERRFGANEIEVRGYLGTRRVVQYLAIPRAPQANPRHAGGVVDFERAFHGAGVRLSHTLTAFGGETTLTAGIDYDTARDDRRGFENFAGSRLGVRGALRRDEVDTVTSFDQYLQLQWRRAGWLLSAGLRHSRVDFAVSDRYVAAGNGDDSGRVSYRRTTPSVGLAYPISPATSLYASAAGGFETPTLNELAYSSGGGSFNFALKPARSRQYEVGVKSLLGERARLDLALFEIRTSDELVVEQSVGGRTSYRNAASSLRQGVEIGGDVEFSSKWQARLALTRMRAIYDSAFASRATHIPAGTRIPGVPQTSAYGELVWRPAAGVSAALEALYRSRVRVDDSAAARDAPGHAIANLRFSAEQRVGKWQISELVRLDNIFDRKTVGSVIVGESNGRYYEPGNGFGWLVGVRARYPL